MKTHIANHIDPQTTILENLLNAHLGQSESARLMRLMHVPQELDDRASGEDSCNEVSRKQIAYALNMLLFRDLVERVPEGRAYTEDVARSNRRVFLDHGAVRTVLIQQSGRLPAGEAALTRILKPLGYRLNDIYPLPRLKMTGRAYFHADLPEEISQFFVSELHVTQFSSEFQAAAARVIDTSIDPLGARDLAQLEILEQAGALAFEDAAALLPALLRCFSRQHAVPSLSDYEILLRESPEMAWIATEGNAFNHVTDRVDDVFSVAVEQRALGRSIKAQVEVAGRGTVRQTAFRAAEVDRVFHTDKGCVVKRVPGSFYEFISRDRVDREGQIDVLDLGFDSSNATAIFKMTAAASSAC